MMLLNLLLAWTAHAGEVNVTGADGMKIHRTLSVCTMGAKDCEAGLCAFEIKNLTCKRHKDNKADGECTFKCAGEDRLLSADQMQTLFAPVDGKIKLKGGKDGFESFSGVKLKCAKPEGPQSTTCTFAHAHFKLK